MKTDLHVLALGEGDPIVFVGHSYGGLLSLLAGARRPEAVRSLTLIEPPALSVARGDPAVEEFVSRLERWYADADDKPAERLRPDFLAAFGFERPTAVKLHEQDRVAALTTAREPPPSEAQVPVDLLAAAPFPGKPFNDRLRAFLRGVTRDG